MTTIKREGKDGSVRHAANGRYTGNFKGKHLGTFDTIEEAEAAIEAAVQASPSARQRTGTRTRSGASAVAAYLKEVREFALDPKGEYIELDGDVKWSTDPDELERAAELLITLADDERIITRELALRSRVIELRDAARKWRARANSRAEVDFTEHAFKYALDHGIRWGAFRDMGVSEETLERAGIPRSM
jgi:hypothetical protein